MDDDEVDEVLAELRHRDAVRVLVASSVVGVPLLVAILLGAGWGEWAPQLLSLCAFCAVVAGIRLRRDRVDRGPTSSRSHPDR